jgi:hypothetical protein
MEPNGIDRAITFVEGTSWFYLSYFLLLPMAVIAIPTSRDMTRFALDVAIIAILSNLVVLFYPTAAERPSLPATDLAYRLVPAVDAPTNPCPSMHPLLGLYSALWYPRLLAGWGRRLALARAVMGVDDGHPVCDTGAAPTGAGGSAGGSVLGGGCLRDVGTLGPLAAHRPRRVHAARSSLRATDKSAG